MGPWACRGQLGQEGLYDHDDHVRDGPALWGDSLIHGPGSGAFGLQVLTTLADPSNGKWSKCEIRPAAISPGLSNTARTVLRSGVNQAFEPA